jgi:hypothetical protein
MSGSGLLSCTTISQGMSNSQKHGVTCACVVPVEHRDHVTNTDYWRGRIDARLDAIETQLATLVVQVSHMHKCVEKRTRTLYLYAGGFAVFVGLVQLAVPFLVKALFK